MLLGARSLGSRGPTFDLPKAARPMYAGLRQHAQNRFRAPPGTSRVSFDLS
jgi:hypothetical protein